MVAEKWWTGFRKVMVMVIYCLPRTHLAYSHFVVVSQIWSNIISIIKKTVKSYQYEFWKFHAEITEGGVTNSQKLSKKLL